MDAVQKCDAVQDAANNFRTAKEAATAIAAQAVAIGEVYDMQAALPDGKILQKDADQAERYMQAAKTKEIQARRKRDGLVQPTISTIVRAIASVAPLPGAWQASATVTGDK